MWLRCCAALWCGHSYGIVVRLGLSDTDQWYHRTQEVFMHELTCSIGLQLNADIMIMLHDPVNVNPCVSPIAVLVFSSFLVPPPVQSIADLHVPGIVGSGLCSWRRHLVRCELKHA